MAHEIEALKARVADLESQLAFQEDAVGALDTALADQQQEVLLLRRQVELLLERLREFEAGRDSPAAPADEKPPHY